MTQSGGAQRHQDVRKTGAAVQVELSEPARGPVITIARFIPWLSSSLAYSEVRKWEHLGDQAVPIFRSMRCPLSPRQNVSWKRILSVAIEIVIIHSAPAGGAP